jgi:hypothetical protein
VLYTLVATREVLQSEWQLRDEAHSAHASSLSVITSAHPSALVLTTNPVFWGMASSSLLSAASRRLAAGGFVQPIQIPFPEAFRLCRFVVQIFFGIIIKRFAACVGAEVVVVLFIGWHDVAALRVHLHAAYRIDHRVGNTGYRVHFKSPQLFQKEITLPDVSSDPTILKQYKGGRTESHGTLLTASEKSQVHREQKVIFLSAG